MVPHHYLRPRRLARVEVVKSLKTTKPPLNFSKGAAIMDKRMFKKTGEELQEYLRIMRKHHVVPSKKGKGSYKRKAKHSKNLAD